MLDKVGRGVDDAGYENHLGRKLEALQRRIFVLVPRIAEFDAEGADRGFGQGGQRLANAMS